MAPAAPDYLAELQRERAEFANYKRRIERERAELIDRATQGLMEELLPVLDHFDRALEHLDDPGIAMVHGELTKVLENHGLRKIEAEGKPFDPNFHEAVESYVDSKIDQQMVTKVYRQGYLLGERVLRAAMVVVARPDDEAPGSDDAESADESPQDAARA